MNKDFFKKTRILDGGMGQELLNRGLKPKGTLWSAHALIDKECHQMIIDTHLDFINAALLLIVTSLLLLAFDAGSPMITKVIRPLSQLLLFICRSVII